MNLARPFQRALTANANSSSFPSKIPTITEPTNDGVVKLNPEGLLRVPAKILLVPILLGANNDVSSMRVIGWRRCFLDSKTTLWIPTILGEFSCTAGNVTGVAGAAVLNTEFFCDTITPVAARIRDTIIGAGTALFSDYSILSPTNDTAGYIVMPLVGFEKVEFTFDQTTNTPTQNVLYAFLDDEV